MEVYEKAKTDKKPGEILLALEALKKRAVALEETASALVGDLGPILQACPEKPGTTSPDQCVTTEVGSQLQLIEGRLEDLDTMLSETRERLGL